MMRTSVIAAALLSAFLAAACSGPGDQIASACAESGEMSTAACDCLGERAEADLSAEQRSTLVELIRTADEKTQPPTAAQIELAFFLAGAAVQCQAEN